MQPVIIADLIIIQSNVETHITTQGAVYFHPLLLLWCRLERLDNAVLHFQQPDLVGGKIK